MFVGAYLKADGNEILKTPEISSSKYKPQSPFYNKLKTHSHRWRAE